MPVLVHLQQEPTRRRFVDEPSRLEPWQLLHREADRLYLELRTLWQTVFADLSGSVDTETLRDAMRRGSLAQAEGVIRGLWHSQVDVVVRSLLLPLFQRAMERTATAMTPALAGVLREAIHLRILWQRCPVTMQTIDLQFSVVVPETLQAIEAYIGTQIVGIEHTTLMAIRAVIRQGFAEGLSLTEQMARIEALIGLTPTQTRRIERLRERLVAEGLSEKKIAQRIKAASRKALALRVEAIARTESITAASMGQQALWRQAERQGLIDETFRRHWIITPDDRLCPICAAIPGLNPQGVGLEEPFQTPVGPVLHPVAHIQCRCAVSLRRTV